MTEWMAGMTEWMAGMTEGMAGMTEWKAASPTVVIADLIRNPPADMDENFIAAYYIIRKKERRLYMSMPKFPAVDEILCRDKAINAVITSIAAEEMALAGLIDAEKDKVRYAVKCAEAGGCTPCELQMLLDVNESVRDMMGQITDMQIVLKNKLALVARLVPKPCPTPCPPCPKPPCPKPCPPCPPHPPCPPCPPCPKPPPKPCHCTSVFEALTVCAWPAGGNLALEETECCEDAARLGALNGRAVILLPYRARFKIEVDVEVASKHAGVVAADLELRCGSAVTRTERIEGSVANGRARLVGAFVFETSWERRENSVAMVLREPTTGVKILRGRISTTKLDGQQFGQQ